MESDKKQERGNKSDLIHWGARILMVLISTVVGGLVSVQVAKIKADAGYTTLVQSMEETQSTLKTLTERVYFMEGEIASLRDRPGIQPLLAPPKSAAMSARRTEFKPIPKNLDMAYMQVFESQASIAAAIK
jgi:hypothetical protein